MTFQQGVAPAVATRSRSRPALVTQAVGPPLPPALESLFGLVCDPVLRLATAPDGQWTVREIGILLGDVLDVLDEDQTIFRAADVLYEAAFAVQDARERRSTCVNEAIHVREHYGPHRTGPSRYRLRRTGGLPGEPRHGQAECKSQSPSHRVVRTSGR